MIPQTIGRYEIKAEIGRGGMATVYEGYDPRFKREVAVKVLPHEFLHDPQFHARFEREAETIATLEHPAIVPVHDFGEEDGQPFIIMRLMTGGSLADRLAKGPLPLAEVARIFNELAPALDKAHAKGIVHRDLKPGNILFDDDHHPYISDFGIAKLSQASATFTGSGVVGTPTYISPEQGRGERNIDGRSDIYALGVIVFQMLTGKAPYEADTPMGVVVKHITEPVPHILDTKPDLPPGCETLIQKAMAKSRDERYATAADVAAALTTLAGHLPAPAVVVGAPVTVDAAEPKAGPIAETLVAPSISEAAEAALVNPAESLPQPAAAVAPPARQTASAPLVRPRPARKSQGCAVAWLLGGLAACTMVGLALIFRPQPLPSSSQATATTRLKATAILPGVTPYFTDVAVTAALTPRTPDTPSKTATPQPPQAAQATAAARANFVGTVQAGQNRLTFPRNGNLTHGADDGMVSQFAEVNRRDFLAEATFFNPYPTTQAGWDYGFLLRQTESNQQFRFIINSNKTWELYNHTGAPDDMLIGAGEAPHLDTSTSGSNLIQLVCDGDEGWLYVNGAFVTEFDASARTNAGDVGIATGMHPGHQIDGKATRYEGFTVWTIP